MPSTITSPTKPATRFVVRSQTFAIEPTVGTLSAGAQVEPGEQVSGGGYDLGDPRLTVDRSMPSPQGNGWAVQIHNPERVTTTATVYVVCAR
jgi:hypothetical protein